MENKELTPETCDGDSCEGCAGCITSTIASSEATITDDADADDEDNTPVGARNYEQQIDSYMAYLASGGLGKLYKKDAAKDDPYYSPNGSSFREHMWVIFATVVGAHLREYAVPQYGDAPDDQLFTWSADQCIKQIGKYMARMDSNARGEQEKLTDLLKIAHYASVAWMKLRDYEKLFSIGLPDEEEEKLEGEISNVENADA